MSSPDDTLKGYRADRKSKSGVESLPTKFDMDTVKQHVAALRDAVKMGFTLPHEMMTPEYLTALALKEGRSDFGANEYNTNNKQAVSLYNTLKQSGYKDEPAQFAAAALDKGQVAERHKVPLPEAWNGLGHTATEDGRVYAQHFKSFMKAAKHPQNTQLYQFIRGNLLPPLPTPPVAQMPQVTSVPTATPIPMPMPYCKGGMVRLI